MNNEHTDIGDTEDNATDTKKFQSIQDVKIKDHYRFSVIKNELKFSSAETLSFILDCFDTLRKFIDLYNNPAITIPDSIQESFHEILGYKGATVIQKIIEFADRNY